jgi:hypothetical protein
MECWAVLLVTLPVLQPQARSALYGPMLASHPCRRVRIPNSMLWVFLLRIAFLPCSAQYLSLSLDQLCTMFELPEKRVYSIVSKMMIAEELHGSWDQPTKTIVMHNLEASKVRQGCLPRLGLAAVC